MKLKIFLAVAILAGLAGVLAVAAAQSTSDGRPDVVANIPPREESFTASLKRVVGGRVWQVGRNENALGYDCVELRSPAGWRAATCFSASSYLQVWNRTSLHRWDGYYSFLYGVAAPGVKNLKVVRSDCSTEELEITDGMFLSVYSPSAPRPHTLVTFDRSGSQLDSHVLQGRGAGAPPSGGC